MHFISLIHKNALMMHLMSERSDHLTGTNKWLLVKINQKIQMMNVHGSLARCQYPWTGKPSRKEYEKFSPDIEYSAFDNLTQLVSRVLIGRLLHFCLLMSPTCCNSPRIWTLVKCNVRQKAGLPIVTKTPS